MDLGLKGKRALVMSSSRGLGRGIAESLAAEGAHVFLTARSGDKLDAAVAAIRAKGGKADAIAADLSKAADVEKLHAAATAAMGGIDILVANTGGPPAKIASAVKPEDWAPHFEQMVTSVHRVIAATLPAMRAQKWGRIIAIASSGVVQPIPNIAISNALRASLVGYLKTLSTEVAPDGVTINVLLPGRIETERTLEIDTATSKAQGKDLAEVEAASRAAIPMGRYGTVEEFASVATFLAGVQAGYVTGSMIRIDGGQIRTV